MSELTSYEQQRLINIQSNEQLLIQLGVKSARTAALESCIISNSEKITKKRKVHSKPKQNSAVVLATRKSSRLKGEEPRPLEEDADLTEDKSESLEDYDGSRLVTADEYFNDEIKSNAIRVDGHFYGWVNPVIMNKHGIEPSAKEAWEKNGGGAFSFLDPTGTGKKRKKGILSNAKADALKMFKKNPNQYFYRHNEPGEEQWLHDWSDEEKSLFLKIANEHGCGDKWGLFATYIPHRVGYQCSNFYRQVILKNGLIFDPNYRYTSSGTPIYVGLRR
ncbi:uncharacterized protein RHIMIDRAFT_241225 [Rhizopus microsporus ATCC 52813]|uniref:Myb-like domain-containing protein n=1 Tax=Rhizopus microsporus ATCC 52813 TaxID=1340429 RepID=A0A2G4SJR7_RHIZD|nr:uncharacterized protein RHIMIDRAFT_241225 [Rhizopus microsporus ATCC 52813]PHZ09020.1 hypothetical protein RHIMIDRAFT_241225 [Rhizopus microsporus ATCC 52813]